MILTSTCLIGFGELGPPRPRLSPLLKISLFWKVALPEIVIAPAPTEVGEQAASSLGPGN